MLLRDLCLHHDVAWAGCSWVEGKRLSLSLPLLLSLLLVLKSLLLLARRLLL